MRLGRPRVVGPSCPPTAFRAPLPSGLGARYDAQLDDAVCPSAGGCVVDAAVFTAGRELGYLLVEAAGSWGVVPVPPPHDLPPGSKRAAAIASFSCPAAGHCVAVGAAHSGTRVVAIRLTQQGGRWPETAFELPAGAASGGPAAISCAAVGNCNVVGGGFGHEEPAPASALPRRAERPLGNRANGRSAAKCAGGVPVGGDLISCPGRGDCSATGSYENHAYDTVGLLMTERRGVWNRPLQPALPSNGNFGQNPLIGLSSLSCPSVGNCTVVGGYFDSQRNQYGLILAERGGRWRRGIQAPLPSNAGPNPPTRGRARDAAALGLLRVPSRLRRGRLLP